MRRAAPQHVRIRNRASQSEGVELVSAASRTGGYTPSVSAHANGVRTSDGFVLRPQMKAYRRFKDRRRSKAITTGFEAMQYDVALRYLQIPE